MKLPDLVINKNYKNISSLYCMYKSIIDTSTSTFVYCDTLQQEQGNKGLPELASIAPYIINNVSMAFCSFSQHFKTFLM